MQDVPPLSLRRSWRPMLSVVVPAYNEAAGLDRFHRRGNNSWMTMAEDERPPRTDKVEVFVVVDVNEERAVAVGDEYRLPADGPEGARPYFRKLRELRDAIASRKLPNIAMVELSMGMSHDFEVAIEEGSTCVRVGTAIFGERAKP